MKNSICTFLYNLLFFFALFATSISCISSAQAAQFLNSYNVMIKGVVIAKMKIIRLENSSFESIEITRQNDLTDAQITSLNRALPAARLLTPSINTVNLNFTQITRTQHNQHCNDGVIKDTPCLFCLLIYRIDSDNKQLENGEYKFQPNPKNIEALDQQGRYFWMFSSAHSDIITSSQMPEGATASTQLTKCCGYGFNSTALIFNSAGNPTALHSWDSTFQYNSENPNTVCQMAIDEDDAGQSWQRNYNYEINPQGYIQRITVKIIKDEDEDEDEDELILEGEQVEHHSY